MDLLIYCSGLITIMIAFFFAFIPSVIARIDLKKKPISYLASVPLLSYFYSYGLLAFSIFLALFTYSLGHISNIRSFSLGQGFIVFGSTSLFVGGIITLRRSNKVHTLFARMCFLFVTVGTFTFSVSLLSNYPILAILGMTSSFIGGIGMWYMLVFKKWHAVAEYWGLFFLSIWILFFYIFV